LALEAQMPAESEHWGKIVRAFISENPSRIQEGQLLDKSTQELLQIPHFFGHIARMTWSSQDSLEMASQDFSLKSEQ
jgi:hypothetical protein